MPLLGRLESEAWQDLLMDFQRKLSPSRQMEIAVLFTAALSPGIFPERS